jgi:hypothetical protein
MWLRSLLSELGFAPSRSITLYGDNQASISIAHNPVGHTRAKQIDIRFHYLRELVERSVLVSMLEQWQCAQHRMRTVRRRIYAAHLTVCRGIIEQLEQVEIDAFSPLRS